jgi:glutamine cyclotransferase
VPLRSLPLCSSCSYTQTKGFAYAADTLAPLGRFATPLRDGWGAAADPGGRLLVLSDGSPVLTWVDPADSFRPVRSVTVRASGRPVSNLNELEFVGGDIYANVWTTECIARICPATGQVTGWVLLQGLRARAVAAANGRGDVDVLNGIAWDAARRRLFVTGKKWPRLYELGLQSVPSTSPTVRQMAASCLQQPSWG